MQILSNYGNENGEHDGLSLIEGSVEKILTKNILPHVGWNSLEIKSNNQILNGIRNNTDFYFTHSYSFKLKNKSQEIASTNYGVEFPSLINKDNIYGVQFHPEKSQIAGEKLIENFKFKKMKKKRLIPVVLIRNGWVVQSNNFNRYKNIGHPIPTIKRLSNFCSDEIIIIDISKNDFYENRREDMNYNFREDIIAILKEISQVIFMPVAIGGKIRNITDARLRIENGAEKIIVNTMCIEKIRKKLKKYPKALDLKQLLHLLIIKRSIIIIMLLKMEIKSYL